MLPVVSDYILVIGRQLQPKATFSFFWRVLFQLFQECYECKIPGHDKNCAILLYARRLTPGMSIADLHVKHI